MIYGYYSYKNKEDVPAKHFLITGYANNTGNKYDQIVVDQSKERVLLKQFNNDTIIVDDITSLGERFEDVINNIREVMKNNKIIIINRCLIFDNSPTANMLLDSFSLALELHKSFIAQRTKESLTLVKESGKKVGRPYGSTFYKLTKNDKQIKEMLRAGFNKSQIARRFNVASTTIYRYLNDHSLKTIKEMKGN